MHIITTNARVWRVGWLVGRSTIVRFVRQSCLAIMDIFQSVVDRSVHHFIMAWHGMAWHGMAWPYDERLDVLERCEWSRKSRARVGSTLVVRRKECMKTYLLLTGNTAWCGSPTDVFCQIQKRYSFFQMTDTLHFVRSSHPATVVVVVVVVVVVIARDQPW